MICSDSVFGFKYSPLFRLAGVSGAVTKPHMPLCAPDGMDQRPRSPKSSDT